MVDAGQLVRRGLYMCAWAVIRHDSEMRRFYDRLRQRGKPGNAVDPATAERGGSQRNALGAASPLTTGL